MTFYILNVIKLFLGVEEVPLCKFITHLFQIVQAFRNVQNYDRNY